MGEYREIDFSEWSDGSPFMGFECQRCGALVVNRDLHVEDHGHRDAHFNDWLRERPWWSKR